MMSREPVCQTMIRGLEWRRQFSRDLAGRYRLCGPSHSQHVHRQRLLEIWSIASSDPCPAIPAITRNQQVYLIKTYHPSSTRRGPDTQNKQSRKGGGPEKEAYRNKKTQCVDFAVHCFIRSEFPCQDLFIIARFVHSDRSRHEYFYVICTCKRIHALSLFLSHLNLQKNTCIPHR